MTQVEHRLCSATTRAGRPCRNKRWVTGDGEELPKCFFHAEHHEVEALRQQARSRGGKVGHPSLQVDLRAALKGEHSLDVICQVGADALAALCAGQLPSKSAAAISSLSNTLLRALELRDVATRLERLESVAAGEAGPPLTAILEAQARSEELPEGPKNAVLRAVQSTSDPLNGKSA